MQIVVWNSQGQKWDDLFTTGLENLVTAANDNVLGLTVEAGWAPWIMPGSVYLGKQYELDPTLTTYDEKSAAKSEFVQGYDDYTTRGRTAFWIPWVANFDALRTNSRCSLGGVYFPRPGAGYNFTVQSRNIPKMVRPTVQLNLSRGQITTLSIYLVHFVSSKNAVKELETLTRSIATIIDQGTPALIVGDININVLNKKVNLAKNWSLIRTGQATQQSGGELDYGLLFDPSGNIQASVQIVAPFKSANNGSDHSMLQYSFARI